MVVDQVTRGHWQTHRGPFGSANKSQDTTDRTREDAAHTAADTQVLITSTERLQVLFDDVGVDGREEEPFERLAPARHDQMRGTR